ncbi:MAG: AEC family transporter [Lachnospiraceae bacterium]|nr:AEC family transporter [Lachnospiraceae bacterium]
MDLQLVLQQMCIVLIFLIIGYFCKKKEKVSDQGVKEITWILLNVCNPGLIISSVLASENRPGLQSVGIATVAILIMFAVQILLGFVMGRIIGADKKHWKGYHSLTIFGNVGFLGVPLAAAVLGNDAVLYMAIVLLIFNFLVYTLDFYLLSSDLPERKGGGFAMILNPGAISAIIAILIYLLDLRVPVLVADTLQYMANAVTFFSMFVIGTTLARFPVKRVFSDRILYRYLALRQVLYPIAFILILKLFISDPDIVGVIALALSVPPGNITVMLSELFGLDTDVPTRAVVLGTLLSVVTITVVTAFV